MDTITALSESMLKFEAKTGKLPYIAIVHPDLKLVLNGATEINGLKIYYPSWNELEMIALMCGASAKDEGFWDKNNAFLMDQEAWDHLTKPKNLGMAPNILDY